MCALVRFLQRNRTNKIYRNVYKERFIKEIVSCGCGGQEIMQSAFCKLEKQKSQCYNSTQGQKRTKTWKAIDRSCRVLSNSRTRGSAI